jgi:hypothetical protein
VKAFHLAQFRLGAARAWHVDVERCRPGHLVLHRRQTGAASVREQIGKFCRLVRRVSEMTPQLAGFAMRAGNIRKATSGGPSSMRQRPDAEVEGEPKHGASRVVAVGGHRSRSAAKRVSDRLEDEFLSGHGPHVPQGDVAVEVEAIVERTVEPRLCVDQDFTHKTDLATVVGVRALTKSGPVTKRRSEPRYPHASSA